MIQLNYLHFSILLFGWSNKKLHYHHFWKTFINFNSLGPNLKIEIRGQILIIFENFEGPIYNFFGNLLGQIENFGKI